MRLFVSSTGVVLLLAVASCKQAPVGSPGSRGYAAITIHESFSGNQWPGRQQDGSTLLPNQWSLRPAGRQISLGDFPVNLAVHPGGRFAAVLHAGYGPHEIAIVELAGGRIVSRTRLNETFYGLEFSADGKKLFASGASDEVVHAFGFSKGKLGADHTITIHDRKERGVPSGLAIDSKARHLFAANVWGNRISVVDLASRRVTEIFMNGKHTSMPEAPAETTVDPDVRAAQKRASAALFDVASDDAFPYACRLDEKRKKLYVSLWAQSQVAVIDLKSNQVVADWPTEEHPCEMALTRSGRFLFAANANRNTVTVFDTENGRAVETIWAAFSPQSPPGATPNSLCLSPDERTLYVANANVNAVAVFDVSAPGRSRSLGFIPVGWYPTSVRVTPDGKHLLVANGKGVMPMANPHGPQPTRESAGSTAEYIGGLLRGTLSVIDLPRGRNFESRMMSWTAQTFQCVPRKSDSMQLRQADRKHPVPSAPGQTSPIKYCIYIVKENRTYDQVFGDIKEGNGDPRLCLFPQRVTPNHHKLAREFTLLDNFYAEAEVSADGHEWSMGAYATDFVEKTWPLNYGHARGGKFPYPSEGDFPIAAPANGYLWDRAKEAGVTYRSYGEFVNNGRTTNDLQTTRVKTLQGHFDERYRGFDLSYSDLRRADRFVSELKQFEAEGEMPRLQIVRLPNDHTHGTTAGFPTPTAYVAENDLALGRVVEAVSRSKFWPETAIFVVEDDAQNGPDHVDAHRTVALVISPYTKRGFVDSTMYSTTSMLRTMELILGLRPLSQFDAAAAPMFNSFQAESDVRPYNSEPANVNLGEKNSSTAWGQTLRMDFSKEDAADDILLNEAVWHSVRGADNPLPAPVRAAFVWTREKDND